MKPDFRYQQLEQTLLQGIEQQRWPPGTRLPSIRTLCQQHQLSKATVVHALQRLEARGLLEARPKSGYYVSHRPANPRLTNPRPATSVPAPQLKIDAPRAVNVSELFLDIMRRSAAFDLLPERSSDDLPPGIVILNRALGRALRRQRGDDFQYYDDPAGLPMLREQLAQQLQRRGCNLTSEQLCITSGCQHALFLALMASCQKGDVVAVEAPGFYGVLQLLQQLQLQAVEVPTSTTTGMDIDALEVILQRWPVRACVVAPAFATPGGALLPDNARQQLLNLAEQHNLAIIEDDIYADTAFNRVPDPLKARDLSGRVMLCSSFSKSLSRDLRLGWISGGRWHADILRLKLVTQLASSRYLQQGVADFLADGSYASHLRRQRYQLRQQRDQLLSVLSQWPGAPQFSAPDGGLALWLELGTDTTNPPHSPKRQINTLALYPEALAHGVIITPGPLFSASGQFTNAIRLSFAHAWTAPRRAALQRLSLLLNGSSTE